MMWKIIKRHPLNIPYICFVRNMNKAVEVNDKKALERIKKQFMKNKKQIHKYANLSMKFNIIFKLMSLNYSFVKIYGIYRGIK